MKTSITARHCDISDELRERAVTVLTRLAGLRARLVDGLVVFDSVPDGATAEIRLSGGRGEPFVARGQDRDHRSALDRAEEKVRRQLARGESRGRAAKDAV